MQSIPHPFRARSFSGRLELKKVLFVVFLFFVADIATSHAAAWPAACGSDAVQYKVKTQKAAYGAEAPEPGKARVVLIEQRDDDIPSPLIRFAFDGTWVGATKGDSYFVTSVEPGSHALCGSRQSGARADKENLAVVKMSAEAGKTYYFLFHVKKQVVGFVGRSNGGAGGFGGTSGAATTPNMTAKDPDSIEVVDFTPLDENQGADVMRKSQLSSFSTK
jgi:hypothetical protein